MSRTRRLPTRGFTLLELLMVVIIIAILAAIALPQYFRTVERTRATEALSSLGAIRSAELRFRAQDPANLYTTDLSVLDIDVVDANSQTPLWTYAVSDTGPGSTVTATRRAGERQDATIVINLDTGAVCTDAPDAYGLQEC